MGLIGRTIEQTRIWVDPTAPSPPKLNHREVFPITVFDAVRKDMDDENSQTLSQALEDIKTELNNRQTKFAAKPANYLMTYAGVAGVAGSIMMTNEIPWDVEKLSSDRIPTEKAVGEYIQKLGLVGDGGTIVDPESRKVRWSDIIGRPLMYEGLGINMDGFITQKGVTDVINGIKQDMEDHENRSVGAVNTAIQRLDDHRNNMDNPHNVTTGQIGAVTQDEFKFHTDTAVNPHNITLDILGVGNIDNTSDMDKPISNATQAVIDKINQRIDSLGGDIGDLDFITTIQYNQSTGKVIITYKSGNTSELLIPIDGLVDDIGYDEDSHELLIYELNGSIKRVDLSSLWIRYIGSVGSHISVFIGSEDDETSAEHDIESVTKDEVQDLWYNGVLPPLPWFDGTPYNITDITAEEVHKMWFDNIMPVESGEFEGIDFSEFTASELYDLWKTGKVPIEEVVGSIGDSIEELKKSGIRIIKAVINQYSITDREIDNEAITTRTIKDGAVTSAKLAKDAVTTDNMANESVTTEKVNNRAINNSKIDNRAVDGRTLFSSSIANRILAVTSVNSDPIWTRVTGDMIDTYTINGININKGAIITSKIKDLAVTTSKLDNESVTSDKIHNKSVTLDKMADDSVDGSKIVVDVNFKGTPSIEERPAPESNDNKVPDTRWVNDKLLSNVNDNINLADRSVDGRVLFTTSSRHRVLSVLRANSDPVWSLIDNDMMDNNSVDTRNLKNNSVSSEKIKDNSIIARHIAINSIKNENICESAVSSESIFTSDNANMVLAAISAGGHPIYSKINRAMIENNAVSTMQIQDGSVTPSKVESSDKGNMVLGVGIKNSNPLWTKVLNSMLDDRSVNGRTLFTSGISNTILGVTKIGTDPAWLKINSDMLMERLIKREHIGTGEIYQEHLQEKIIESRHIMDWSIKSNNIAPRAITGTELFTSPLPNRVLAVTTMPYSNPDWLQITTDMVEDKAITKEKIFQSDNPYRVLGATQAGVPPEYLMITHNFIVDGTIIPSKLVRDFSLLGTPELTVPPSSDADNYQLANTRWVREFVGGMINDFHPEILFDTVNSDIVKDMIKDAIADHSIDGTKLFVNQYDGPRVIGVTKKGEDAEYILIESDLIVNGAVTSDKIQRSVNLHGSPTIEVRPSPLACDNNGGGTSIPDCQWVLDRISAASIGGGGTSGGSIPTYGDVLDNSITTSKINNRAVTGDKMFTSSIANRILAVLNPNTDPVYTTINNEMIGDRSVDARTLFSSEFSNRVLVVTESGKNPSWSLINHNMIDHDSIGTNNIQDQSVTKNKIANNSIGYEQLEKFSIIETNMLTDRSVTTSKIGIGAVETTNIKDNSVTSKKLDRNLVLKGHPTVEPDPDLEVRSLRNVIISPNAPSGGNSGDIWFRYI